MAQAARLNLRMQKEIKLLLNDPPPGVSLNLSENQNLSSLSSIEARIEGPEGTVYSKGAFVLRIQIPERYPFQPPNVTFVTPIYHPNIDNGGRICLDILNLPPKGAWQPSLNISAVLTSIGLLLSEPNPDDGLMAEISREYKYNRQVFDQNARSWTEKYANPAASDSNGGSFLGGSFVALQSQMEIKSLETLPKVPNKECVGNQKKRRLLGQKLSLKSAVPKVTSTDDQQNTISHQLSSTSGSTECAMDFSDHSFEKGLSGQSSLGKQNPSAIDMIIISDRGGILSKELERSQKNLQLLGPKLSLESEKPETKSKGNEENMIPHQLPLSKSNSEDPIMVFSDVASEIGVKSTKDLSECSAKEREGSRKKLHLLSQKLSLKSEMPKEKINDTKENMKPNQLQSSISSSKDSLQGFSDVCFENSLNDNGADKVVSQSNKISIKECEIGQRKEHLPSQKRSLKPEIPGEDSADDKEDMIPNHLPSSTSTSKTPIVGFPDASLKKASNQNSSPVKQKAHDVDTIVVSDSEESGDECDRPSWSRLSFTRKRMAGRWKS